MSVMQGPTTNRWVRSLPPTGRLRQLTLSPIALAIDKETFDVMWQLSAPGGEAEHCFMRVSQTDYLLDGRDECLDWMPDVRSFGVVDHVIA